MRHLKKEFTQFTILTVTIDVRKCTFSIAQLNYSGTRSLKCRLIVVSISA